MKYLTLLLGAALTATLTSNALAAKELHYQCKLGRMDTEIHLTQENPPTFIMSNPNASVVDGETGFVEIKPSSINVRRFPENEELGWVFYLNRSMGAASFRTFTSLNLPVQALTGSCKRKHQ